MEIIFSDKNFLKETEKDIISTFTYECLVYLKLSKKIIKNLSIEYEINFFDEKVFDGLLATVDCDDDQRYPKFFTIEFLVDKENPEFLKDALFTIAHELIHVKQFAINRLKYGQTANKMIFEKTEFDRNEIDYHDLPWEVEAFSKEKEVYENAIKKCTSLE